MTGKTKRSPEERIAAEITAAKTLKLVLGNDADDAELFRDMIEGSTSFFEVLDAVYDAMRKDEEFVDGIVAREGELAVRKARIQERIGWRKAKLEMAILAYGDKVERPEATFSLRQNAPGVLITDEAAIPAKYWKPSDPKLDRALLSADLKAAKDDPNAEPIPGATLNNAPQTLTIRKL
jgi:hypothetical protein